MLFTAATAAYAVAAWSVKPGFYDGFAPTNPYHWVSPPPQLQAGNQQPASGHLVVSSSGGSSQAIGAATDDGQAQLLVPKNGFQLGADTKQVVIDIKPVAVYPPLTGFRVETNVYLITTTAPLAQPATVMLRYAVEVAPPLDVYFADPGGGGWTTLTPQPASQNFIAGTTTKVGYFMGASKEVASSSGPGPSAAGGSESVPTLPLIVGGAIAIVVLASVPYLIQRRSARKPRRRSPARGRLSDAETRPKTEPRRSGKRRGKRRR